jgi:hypothetical protein
LRELGCACELGNYKLFPTEQVVWVDLLEIKSQTPQPFAFQEIDGAEAVEGQDEVASNLPRVKISFDVFECAERQSVFLWHVR